MGVSDSLQCPCNESPNLLCNVLQLDVTEFRAYPGPAAQCDWGDGGGEGGEGRV